MSVDQKHNINFKSVEEERAQLEAIRNSLSEKDEDQKSESSSMDESSSESETGRMNWCGQLEWSARTLRAILPRPLHLITPAG